MKSKVSVQNKAPHKQMIQIKNMEVGTYFVNDADEMWLKINEDNLCFPVSPSINATGAVIDSYGHGEVVDVEINWRKKYEEN